MATGTVLSVAGVVVICAVFIETERALFETDARIVHRLLSQQAVQHDAILDTLALWHPAPDAPGQTPPQQRLSALYPHILAVQRRDLGQPWAEPGLVDAEARSLKDRRAALVKGDMGSGRFQLVLGAEPTAFALTLNTKRMVPWSAWPMDRKASPVRVLLEHEGKAFVLQTGDAAALDHGLGWRFSFRKTLAAVSQPFDVVAERRLGWMLLPWGQIAIWLAAVWGVLALVAQWQRQRTARRRAEDLLRFGQVARLNTLGQLAAGLAHELNQPLTALLANTQAARRLLAETPPDIETARTAMDQAVGQAHRASDVVGRLRKTIERPQAQGDEVTKPTAGVELLEIAQRVSHLLAPEFSKRGVHVQMPSGVSVRVNADAVAVEQIVHNLLINALQAMDSVDPERRVLTLQVRQTGAMGELEVADRGPGIPPDALPRVFEPFFSTREGGLGLGLSLCETLAQGMGGSLVATNRPDGGACFVLSLPLETKP